MVTHGPDGEVPSITRIKGSIKGAGLGIYTIYQVQHAQCITPYNFKMIHIYDCEWQANFLLKDIKFQAVRRSPGIIARLDGVRC